MFPTGVFAAGAEAIMRLTKILDDTVSIRSEMSNAVISFSEMTASIVAVVTDVVRDGRPVVGFGFNSNGRYSQSAIIRSRHAPRLLKVPPAELLDESGENFDPFRCWAVMMRNEKPGGHGERPAAVGAIDMALWDIVAKIEGKPLFRVLAERFGQGPADPNVYVYAAGGYYYPNDDLQALRNEMRRYRDLGYEHVKMKVGGASLATDLRRIEAVLEVVPEGRNLAVDANGRFDLPAALEFSGSIAPYKLKWYEEPGDPLDYELLARVAEHSTTPLATGENLFSYQDSRNLVLYGGLNRETSFLQMDPALSYGVVEYLRTLDMLRQHGWSWRRCIPHGGHQMTLHIAAGLGLGGNESYPGVFQPFGGFADGSEVKDGYVRVPEEPGIGIELKSNLYQVFRELLASG